MGIKTYKPTSPGRRNASVSDFADLTDKEKKPEKRLTVPLKKTGGRNHHGIITARCRGGGHKRMYRLIDWRRHDRDGQPAAVTHIEYDPNRSARIALVQYPDGEKRYILAPDGLAAGMSVMSGAEAEPKVGNCLPLAKIPTGLQIHNIEMQPGSGGKLVRAAGVSATLTAREGTWAGDHAPLGRGPAHPGGLPRHDRHGVQPGSYEHSLGQSRQVPLAGPPAAHPRRGHESPRPSDGRRRGPHLGRPQSLLADRRSGQGRQDPQAPQTVEQGHHPPAQERAVRAVEDLTQEHPASRWRFRTSLSHKWSTSWG